MFIFYKRQQYLTESDEIFSDILILKVLQLCVYMGEQMSLLEIIKS